MPYDFLENLQRFARMNNIFGDTTVNDPYQVNDNRPPLAYGDETQPTPYGGYGQTSVTDVNDFTPTRDMIDKFAAGIESMPVRPNDQSKLRRIIAGIASIEHPQAADNMMYGKFNRELADWKLKQETLGTGASQERMANTTGINAGKLKISQQRANVYAWKNTHPNWVIKTDKDGFLIGINPQDGKGARVADENGEPIKSSVLPDAEKIKLTTQGRLDVVEAQGQNASELENQRSGNDLTEIAARGGEARRTKATIPGGTAAGMNKPESPAAARTRMVNQAVALKAEHPEWAKFITIDGNNVSIKAPSNGGWFGGSGPDEKTYNAIKSAIFGGGQNMATNSSEPKIGDTKKFPNGKMGKWDGKGWVEVK